MIPADIERFLQATGKKGERALSFLGQTSELVEALNSKLGKALLKDAVDRHNELSEKVLNDINSTLDDKMERKALYGILIRWASIINQHEEAKAFVRKSVQKGDEHA